MPLVGGAFLVVLDETVLSVALPSIMSDLNVRAGTAQWVTSAYMLTMATAIPASGFLLRRMGARHLFVIAMTLFSVGALIAALSTTFALLCVARVVQACGAAVMMPVLMATVAAMVPTERRGTVMGTATIVVGAAPVIFFAVLQEGRWPSGPAVRHRDQQVMRAALDRCRSHGEEDAYTEFRGLLMRRPVLTDQELFALHDDVTYGW